MRGSYPLFILTRIARGCMLEAVNHKTVGGLALGDKAVYMARGALTGPRAL